MSARLVSLCVDANDPHRLGAFWAGMLDRQTADGGRTLLPSEETGLRVEFRATLEQKVGRVTSSSRTRRATSSA